MICSGDREKRNYQEHEKASFSQLPEFQNSFFIRLLRKRLIHFLSVLALLCYLFLQESVQIAVYTCFYKIDALKNLAIFTGKHLRCIFFIINFTKKILQHSCFPTNIAKCLGSAFYIEPSRSFWFSEILFDDRITLDVFQQKIDIFHIPSVIALFSFVTLVLQKENHHYFIYILFLYQHFCQG